MPLEEEEKDAAALFGDDGRRTKFGTGDGLLLGLVLDGAVSNEVTFLAEVVVSAAFSSPLETGRAVSFGEFFTPLAASVKGIPLEGENPRPEVDKEEDLLILSVKSMLLVDKTLKDAFPPIIPGHLS